jgi:uncharacterized repeat protein (TIGR04076 family)
MKYYLFDLEVTTTGNPKTFNCSHKLGDGLIIKGENMYFLPDTKHFSHYAIATLVPYIAAKQRADQESDFMYFETDIACPDPLCGARFSFKRTVKREYEYIPRK